ncbi:putative F-box/LRR-repeat protein At5g02700 [Quercus lobata]|uniref:putative F-box/LRR-repeat protein At5g02700 n=1 Tax=Quercus lobata TaxID=97700 RepID=UPI001244C0B3|nr:putative F-box/LRR-repeat protein At5g02700 [Quercus lobata]
MKEESQNHGSIDGETERGPTSNTDRNPISEEQEEEEESSDDHRTKRRKHSPILEEDRISTLPDSILLSILCFLPTKDPIKTGVLSKRWSYLWTSVPSLSFEHGSFQCIDDFTSAVDHTLLPHRAPMLRNFFVLFNYETHLKPCLDLWFRFATTAKVDQLSILLTSTDFSGSEEYPLPPHLYTNEFVSELDFYFYKIKPNGVVNLSSLTRLTIGFNFTALCEVAIKKVVMGSPRLEYLELDNCCRVNRLDLVSESLRKLVIHSYFMRTSVGRSPDPVFELEIVAPKIRSLEILGCFLMKKCRIKDVSSLVEAKLDFNCEVKEEDQESAYKVYEQTVRELLESLHHVRDLTVGKWCLMRHYNVSRLLLFIVGALIVWLIPAYRIMHNI